MKNFFKNTSVFDICFRILLIVLPFTTILSVWTREVIGLGGFAFYKEGLLAIMFLYLAQEHIRGKLKIVWSWIDVLIF